MQPFFSIQISISHFIIQLQIFNAKISSVFWRRCSFLSTRPRNRISAIKVTWARYDTHDHSNSYFPNYHKHKQSWTTKHTPMIYCITPVGIAIQNDTRNNDKYILELLHWVIVVPLRRFDQRTLVQHRQTIPGVGGGDYFRACRTSKIWLSLYQFFAQLYTLVFSIPYR